MLAGTAKRIFTKGPAGPAGATAAAALTDVVSAVKAVLTAPDLAGARSALGLAIGSSVQAWSATLDALALLSTTAFGRSLLTQADAPTALGTLGGVPSARQITAGAGLSGGGDLTADRGLALAGIATGTLLANATAGPATAVPVATTPAALLDAAFGTTRGTLLVRASGGWTALALGASGYTLQSNGVDLVYAASSPGAGAVRYDTAQGLTPAEQVQERRNTGAVGAGVLAKTAAYTVAATDAGKLVTGSGTWALTMPPPASVVAGFVFAVKNTGTGQISLTPNGSETIDGLTSLVVNRREGGLITFDGTNWQAVGFEPVVVAASNGASSGYVRYSNGYTVQWGSVAGGSADVPVTFPLTYTSMPAVVANGTGAASATNVLEAIGIDAKTTSGFIGRPRFTVSGSGGVAGDAWNWRAEGFI